MLKYLCLSIWFLVVELYYCVFIEWGGFRIVLSLFYMSIIFFGEKWCFVSCFLNDCLLIFFLFFVVLKFERWMVFVLIFLWYILFKYIFFINNEGI